MKEKRNNYAFIDAQNLHLGIKNQGWILDMARFRRYLTDKYSVTQAFLFIGYKPGNEHLYAFFQKTGYICIFKPIMTLPNGQLKGNVDAELVLHAMIEYPSYDQAIIVSGDGDFRCLIEYLLVQQKLKKVLIPHKQKYSGLLKSLSTGENNVFDFLSDLSLKLGKVSKKNEKGSQRDGTLREPFSS